MEKTITINDEAMQASPSNGIDGRDAYYLSQTYHKNEKFLQAISENKIVHLNYQTNILKKIDLDK